MLQVTSDFIQTSKTPSNVESIWGLNNLFDEVPTNGAKFLKEDRREHITPNVFNNLPRFNNFYQETTWIQQHG